MFSKVRTQRYLQWAMKFWTFLTMNYLWSLSLGLTFVRETTLFLLASGINNDNNIIQMTPQTNIQISFHSKNGFLQSQAGKNWRQLTERIYEYIILYIYPIMISEHSEIHLPQNQQIQSQITEVQVSPEFAQQNLQGHQLQTQEIQEIAPENNENQLQINREGQTLPLLEVNQTEKDPLQPTETPVEVSDENMQTEEIILADCPENVDKIVQPFENQMQIEMREQEIPQGEYEYQQNNEEYQNYDQERELPDNTITQTDVIPLEINGSLHQPLEIPFEQTFVEQTPFELIPVQQLTQADIFKNGTEPFPDVEEVMFVGVQYENQSTVIPLSEQNMIKNEDNAPNSASTETKIIQKQAALIQTLKSTEPVQNIFKTSQVKIQTIKSVQRLPIQSKIQQIKPMLAKQIKISQESANVGQSHHYQPISIENQLIASIVTVSKSKSINQAQQIVTTGQQQTKIPQVSKMGLPTKSPQNNTKQSKPQTTKAIIKLEKEQQKNIKVVSLRPQQNETVSKKSTKTPQKNQVKKQVVLVEEVPKVTQKQPIKSSELNKKLAEIKKGEELRYAPEIKYAPEVHKSEAIAIPIKIEQQRDPQISPTRKIQQLKNISSLNERRVDQQEKKLIPKEMEKKKQEKYFQYFKTSQTTHQHPEHHPTSPPTKNQKRQPLRQEQPAEQNQQKASSHISKKKKKKKHHPKVIIQPKPDIQVVEVIKQDSQRILPPPKRDSNTQPNRPEVRLNSSNILQEVQPSASNQSRQNSDDLPPLTCQVLLQAEKERMASTFAIFNKYVLDYTRAITFYKNIVENVSSQIEKRRAHKRNLLAALTNYFEGYAKLNNQFSQKCNSFHNIQERGFENQYCNFKFQFKRGYEELITLRKTVASSKNKISTFVVNHILKNIEKSFNAYFEIISVQQLKQLQRRQQHRQRQKVFYKQIAKIQKIFNEGIKGKFKTDILAELAHFVNQQVTHREYLHLYGKGLLPIHHALRHAESELFSSLQLLLNNFKNESKVIYSVGWRYFQHLQELTSKINDSTNFTQLCTLTDLDYIKFVLELQLKQEQHDFTNRHFENYLDLIFLDKLVGNIRDSYKGAITKVFPMAAPHEELIHTVSNNLVHFNTDTDSCITVLAVKRTNAKIVANNSVEFDELIKGIIFDDNRTVRIKLLDSDRCEELICYLNEIEEDFVIEPGVSAR